jgi:hypothetical protein
VEYKVLCFRFRGNMGVLLVRSAVRLVGSFASSGQTEAKRIIDHCPRLTYVYINSWATFGFRTFPALRSLFCVDRLVMTSVSWYTFVNLQHCCCFIPRTSLTECEPRIEYSDPMKLSGLVSNWPCQMGIENRLLESLVTPSIKDYFCT